MAESRNHAIAWELRRLAAELDRKEANPFRVRAYRRAADAISSLPEDAAAVARRGELRRIKGIGPDLAKRIEAYCERGSMNTGTEGEDLLPAAIAGWASLPGFSTSILRYLHDRLQIRTLDDLEALVRSRFLRTLPDVTAADDEILEEISRLRARLEA
ncbi:MAG TPA: helix-hairpin-helix domain-containing protein [Nitrospirales bacterium]|jgi:DNA polymerase (family 10)